MDVVIGSIAEVFVAILIVLFGGIVVKLFRYLVWSPYTFQKAYIGQGIRGPTYQILTGAPESTKLIKEANAQPLQNISHDIVPRIMPHYHKWCEIYGDTFFYWYGVHSRLYISEPELIKEILSNKFGHYEKPGSRPLILTLLGRGLILIDGVGWVNHRRIVSHAFNVDKLKTMVKEMTACTSSMLNNWQEIVAQGDYHGKEIDVHNELRELTSEIISHTAFGSNYNEGKEVFELQRELQVMAAQAEASVFIPGSQYIPTRKNRYTWKIDRRVKEILNSIIQGRLESTTTKINHVGYGDDLLGIMLTANQKELGGSQRNISMTIDEIMDECKTFFFAGHETTSNLLTWAIFLLAINPKWQEELRKEVISVCGTDIPDANMLSKMKLMNMVLNETLRLYPPATMLVRTTYEEIKLRNFSLLKGASLTLPILAVHHNEKFWGPDVNLFKPERFAEGTSRAPIHPNAFFPFSLGPRNCVGQNFALLEAKSVLTMILQKLSFKLSPSYQHAPIECLLYNLKMVCRSYSKML